MTTKISLVASPAAALAAVRTHWQSLRLDEGLIDALEARLSVSGSLAFAQADGVALFGHTNDIPTLVDLYVPDEDADLWRAPLASADTTAVQATRGELTLPVMANAAIARPLTPRYSLAGFVLPVEEPNGDYPTPAEWYQRTPGVEPASKVPQVGTIERVGEQRYVCETAQTDLGGVMVNYFRPGTVGSGWRAVASGDGYDPWDAGTTYGLGDRVTDEGEDWLNRDASNTGRKPGSAAAGWLRISGRPYPYYYLGNAGYPLTVDGEPMQVTDAGRLWQVTADGAGASSFPPSVVGTGWQDMGPI